MPSALNKQTSDGNEEMLLQGRGVLQAMRQTWTLGREHCVRVELRSGKNASTAGRESEVGSARKRDADRAALAMARSWAMAR